MLGYQARRLAELRAFAIARSPFYRELHRGLEDARLGALPPVTKAMLMERFDDVVTDREVRLADVEAYLQHANVNDRFRRRYLVEATGGTTGRRGILLADRGEWTTVLAGYARAQAWAGLVARLTSPIRMATVASRAPTHQSSLVGASARSRLVPTLRLDATDPLEHTVAALNEFRPDSLVAYPSVARRLADEQLAGRLRLSLRTVLLGSEVLTDETRGRVREAFGIQPTNMYGATETGLIAADCVHGHLHRFEDLVISEIVDEDDRPVPDGEFGAKLLVSVLFSRTQPLIRYEISDRVAAQEASPGDLPFSVLDRIEGRQEEVLTLAGFVVHPNVFHDALEGLPLAGWQVVDEGEALRILIEDAGGLDPASVSRAVEASLAAIGVSGVPVRVELVGEIPRTALGKLPLVRRTAAALPNGQIAAPV